MLKLVLGVAGTGKTRELLDNIKKRALCKKHSLFIVPEQFSSTAEGIVYRELGDELSGHVTVCSFTGYAEQILELCGGVAEKTITDAARVVLVRRALDKLGDTLPQLYRHRRSIAFCALCADTIKELKTAGCKASDLARLSTDSENGDKLRELGLVYAAYEAITANTAYDAVDRMTRAAEQLSVELLEETAVYIDNFDGFTYPEYKLIAKLLQAAECTVALCCDSIADNDGGLALFSPVKNTAARLRALAAKSGVAVAAVKVLNKDYRHLQAHTLLKAAKILEYGEGDDADNTDNTGVYVASAKNKYEECKLAAAHIKRLAQKGIPYGKMAVICRTQDDYKTPLCYELKLAGIPYFMDESVTLEYSAAAVLLRAGLALAIGGITAEGILRFIKTGLCGYTDEQLAALENYIYTWRLGGSAFKEPFTLSVSGFGKESAQDKADLAQLEAMRADIMPRLNEYLSEVKQGTAACISRAVYKLIIAFGADKALLRAAAALKSDGNISVADKLVAAWNEVMSLLSQMELLLCDGNVTVSEYDELFLLLLRSSEIGAVPELQNAVIFTQADRMRLEQPQVCLLLGVSEGIFPKAVGYSGLLTHADRELLVEGGIDMPGSFETRSLLEQMFFYKAVTAAQEEVYFSYIPAIYGGAPMASPLELLVNGMGLCAYELGLAQYAAGAAAAVDILADRYGESSVEMSSLREAILRDGTQIASLQAMEAATEKHDYVISDKSLVRELVGTKLKLSPTRIEQYYSCSFAYFLQYVLGIRARRHAELSPLESGTLVHYILEKSFIKAGNAFTSLTDGELGEIASAVADEYISENMPDSKLRFKELIKKIKASVTRLLIYLREEQKQSSFHPVAFEQEIGDGGIKPLTLTTPTGEKVSVVGKIDRVDVMRREGKSYIRVVDYKTGNKSFDLDEVYCGLNTQMLLYLFTVAKSEDARFASGVPAGVLYLQGDPAPKLGARDDAPQECYHLDGILLDDKLVLRGMDKAATGLYVPLRFKKDGSTYATDKLATLAKLGNIERHIEKLVAEMAARLYEGDIAAVPLVTKKRRPCEVCDYRYVCLHEDGICEKSVSAPDNAFAATEAQHEMD